MSDTIEQLGKEVEQLGKKIEKLDKKFTEFKIFFAFWILSLVIVAVSLLKST